MSSNHYIQIKPYIQATLFSCGIILRHLTNPCEACYWKSLNFREFTYFEEMFPSLLDKSISVTDVEANNNLIKVYLELDNEK